MLPVAQKLFAQAGRRSGIDSTHHIASLRTMIPFVLPSKIYGGRPTRCGRGMIVPVSGQGNTSIAVTHNLGRFAQVAWVINNTGNFSPRLMFDPNGIRTEQVQSIIADGVMNKCMILFF